VFKLRVFGPPNVEKMKSKNDVIGLIKALDYKKDDSVRDAAARALGELCDPRAVEPLIDCIWKDGFVAINSLGEIGDPRAVQPLIDLLKREEGNLQYTGTTSRKYFSYIFSALSRIGPPSVEPLTEVFKNTPNKLIRIPLIKAIGDTGAPEALDWLLDVLDSYSQYGVAVVEALGRFGDIRSVEKLTLALKANDEDLHEAAARALDKLGWVPDLGEAGAYYWVAKRNWNNAISFGSLAVEPLITVLWDEGNLWADRQAAADALGAIGVPSVEPLIVALCKADERWHRGRAKKQGMGNVWSHSDMRPRTIDLCEDVIRKIGKIDTLAEGKFLPGLRCRDQRVRDFTLWAINELGCSLK
jgi:HEAT repeat protein